MGLIVTRPAGLPSFKAPPLNEVAMSVQFMPCRGYTSLTAAKVWDLFSSDFTTVQEQQALTPSFETFGPSRQQINFGFIQGPISNRFAFISVIGDEVIQFQSDKFIHNWRKVDNNMVHHTYPHFEKIFKNFCSEINKLDDFFIEQQGSPIVVNQAEITYVNHIDIAGNRNPSDWLRYIAPVGVADDFVGNFRRVLYGQDGKPEARLICESASATDAQGRPLIVMTLTIRGAPKGTGVHAALEFLRKSRETIVGTFAELTTDSAHGIWERTQ